MSPSTLVEHLRATGIRLGIEGDEFYADVLPGVGIGPYRETIHARKVELLAELRLREQIIAAATVEPEDFDRIAYEALWDLWHKENAS